MNLLGAKVKHKVYGTGEIVEVDDKHVTVVFPTKTTKFQYPAAFEFFISAVDENVQMYVISQIENAKQATAAAKQLEEQKKRETAEKKALEEAAQRASISRRTGYTPKPVVASQRIDGQRLIFWVFQGQSFDQEFRGGYIWAPISNKAGTTPHHWTRLLDIRKGDIILHGCDGMLKAISIAKDACFDCKQPKELEVEDLWDVDGRMVECDYISIDHPIKTATFVNDIVRLCGAKYSPFTRYGGGNMGYLYEINRELARIFVAATVRKNPHLGTIDFIDELLNEVKND